MTLSLRRASADGGKNDTYLFALVAQPAESRREAK